MLARAQHHGGRVLTDRAIARLRTLFLVLFALLGAAATADRTLRTRRNWRADPRNPRRARHRGRPRHDRRRDGTPLALTRDGRRVYPLGAVTAHVVGYASPRYGTAGLEDAFDRVLARRRAPMPGRCGRILSSLPGAGAPHGAEIVTTLDLDVQRALAAALSGAPRAAGIVLDPRSGAVLALAATPSFDPNTLEKNWPRSSPIRRSPLLDRSTLGLYPPGSTFKIVTAADALEAGLVTPATHVRRYRRSRRRNVHRPQRSRARSPGTQDLTGAFALSSNVDFARDRAAASASTAGLPTPRAGGSASR